MSDKPRGRAFAKAAVASFGVYLLPLIGRHGALPLGLAVWAEFFEFRSDRDALWLAVDAALVAAIQLTALGLFYCSGAHGAMQVFPERAHGCVAILGCFLHGAKNDAIQGRRHVRNRACGRRRVP